jgi:TolB-like protein
MSDSTENAYFADGVQEDILTGLASIGDLSVISRTSVMSYRDTTKPIEEIGRELGGMISGSRLTQEPPRQPAFKHRALTTRRSASIIPSGP